MVYASRFALIVREGGKINHAGTGGGCGNGRRWLAFRLRWLRKARRNGLGSRRYMHRCSAARG